MSASIALDVEEVAIDEDEGVDKFHDTPSSNNPFSSINSVRVFKSSTNSTISSATGSASTSSSTSRSQKKKQKQKANKQWQIDPVMMQQAFDVLKTSASTQINAPPPPATSSGRRRERTDSHIERGSSSSPISDSDRENNDDNLIAPPLPSVLPKILSNLSEQLFLPIRSFTDVCHCWPRLTAQVSQGLASCASFGEYLVDIGPEVSAIGPSHPPLDAMAAYAKATSNALVSEHSERVQAYQLRKALAEQVGKPLLKFVIEARTQFMALVGEEQRATKTVETLMNQVSDQKGKCMTAWEEFKSWDGKGKGPQSAVPSSVAAVLRKYSTAPPAGKSTLDQACKDFHCYETLLKRLNGDQVRYIRDMDRLLLALETIEKGRLQALYSALQTYNLLKQQQATLPNPTEQLAQYFASFDPADFRRLRFSAVTYDLPCSPEDFKEGILFSTPETITKVSAEVALGSFDLVSPVAAIRVAPPPPPFSRTSGALPSSTPATTITIPPSSKFLAANANNSPPPIPPSIPEMNEDEKRTHVARLLSAEPDLELPKLHSEESDQTGSGYLELMANSLNTSTLASTWKTLYCTVRSAKLMISTRKGETSLFASYYLRAARFTRYGPLDVKGRPHCFSIYFPHSNQRVVFAAKTEMGVVDWLQALTRTAVSGTGVLGRAVIMPSLALAENNEGIMKRLDTIEKSLVWFREYVTTNASKKSGSPPNGALSEDSGEDGDVESTSPRIQRGTHGNLWKESQLSSAIKVAYSKAEMSGYLDRLLVGWVEHEPYLGMGSHCHWDLMASVNRKYWLIIKIFLSGGPNVLKVVKPSMTKNIDRLAKVILNIANFVGTASELMDTFIYHEVASTPRETQLFRTDSLTTKMWGYFSALEGKSYVYKLLSKPVHACFLDASEGSVSFELDSSKIDTTVHEKKQITPLAHSRSSSGGWWFSGKKSNDDDPQSAGPVRRRSSVNTSNHGEPISAEDRPRRASSPSVPPTAAASTPTANASLATPPISSPPLPPLFLAGRLADVERAWFLSHRNHPEPELKIAPKTDESHTAPKDGLKVKSLIHSSTQQEGVRQALNTNQTNLEQALQLFLNEIIRSLEYCPRALRVAAHSVQRAVGEAFPSAKWSAVGGFFFLRFLVPQILMVPWAADTASNPQARRNLVVMTKVLQILANSANADGGSREQIMGLLAAKESSIQTMVGFVLQNVERLTKFLMDLANPPDPRFFQNLVEPSAQMLEEQARELESDLEWFFVNILASLDIQTET